MIPVKDPLCPLVLSDWMVKPYKSLVPLRTQRNASVSFMEYVRCVFQRPYYHTNSETSPLQTGIWGLFSHTEFAENRIHQIILQ